MPIDPNIALSFRGMQVADPLAQYGQVQNILAAQSQRQAAGTSNELTQVQLGQARMTLQQAQEAQNTVAQIMGTIGQHGGPADPMEAAMLMLKDPRRQVQDTGGHLLDSHQKVLAYQQQAQFLKDQTPEAAAAQPEPVAPAAPPYEESPTFGAPVDSSPAISMPVFRGTQTNALASATPTTAPVNALAAPERTAQSLAAEIKQKDRQYGTAPGWLKQRELMVLQYKEALDPRHATFAAINPKDYTQDSIAKFNKTKNYSDLVEKVDLKTKNLGNVSPGDYTPDSVQRFAVSGNYSDLILKPTKVDNLIGNVTPADYTADSLAKFATSKNYTDLVLKPAKVDNKTISNVNPDSYTPDSLARFSTSGNYADLVLRPSKTDKTIGNVSPADYTPKSVAKFNVSGNYADLVPKPPPSPTKVAANQLRDEVNALTKDFRVVQDAYTKIKNVASTGAGDMSLLYSFIKLLDPGSVVRESEFAAAAQSGSYGERIQGAVNRAITGQRLPDDLRKDFLREADSLYNSQKSGADRVNKHYTEIAIRAGLDPKDVIVPYAAPVIIIPDEAPEGAVRQKGK